MSVNDILRVRLLQLTETKRNETYERKSDKRQAVEMGINYNTFYKYLNGTAACPAHNLLKIADYYGVSTDYLLGRTDVRTLDTDIKAACEYTGLPESVVKVLHSRTPKNTSIVTFTDSASFAILGSFKSKGE